MALLKDLFGILSEEEGEQILNDYYAQRKAELRFRRESL